PLYRISYVVTSRPQGLCDRKRPPLCNACSAALSPARARPVPDARESEPDRAEVQRVFPRPHRLLVHGLTVERGGRTVLAGLDLELEAGRSLIVTGANGVGKSTLLRAIAELVPSVAGTIALEG